MAAQTQKTFLDVSSGSPEYTDSINVGINGSVVLHVEPGATLPGRSPPAYNVNLQLSAGGEWVDVATLTSAVRNPDGTPVNFQIMDTLPAGAAIRVEAVSTNRGSSTVYLVT